MLGVCDLIFGLLFSARYSVGYVAPRRFDTDCSGLTLGSQSTGILSTVNIVNDSSSKEVPATHTVALGQGDDELFPALQPDYSSEPGDVAPAQPDTCQASQAGPVEDTTTSSQTNSLPDTTCDIAPATQQFFDVADIQTSELDGPVVDYLCQFIATAPTVDRDDLSLIHI